MKPLSIPQSATKSAPAQMGMTSLPSNPKDLMKFIKLQNNGQNKLKYNKQGVGGGTGGTTEMELLESRLMHFEDFFYNPNEVNRQNRYFEALKMETEDDLSNQIETVFREEKSKNDFRDMIRKEAEERKRLEIIEKERRKKAAEERRMAVVERIRKQKELEEQRLREIELNKLRIEEEKVRLERERIERLQADRYGFSYEDEISHLIEQDYKEQLARKLRKQIELQKVAEWERQQKIKDKLDDEKRKQRMSALEEKRNRLIELKRLQDLQQNEGNADNTNSQMNKVREDAAKINKQLRIQNKAKFVSKKIQEQQVNRIGSDESNPGVVGTEESNETSIQFEISNATNQPSTSISRNENHNETVVISIESQNELIEFNKKITEMTSENVLREQLKSIMVDKRSLRLEQRNRVAFTEMNPNEKTSLILQNKYNVEMLSRKEEMINKQLKKISGGNETSNSEIEKFNELPTMNDTGTKTLDSLNMVSITLQKLSLPSNGNVIKVIPNPSPSPQSISRRPSFSIGEKNRISMIADANTNSNESLFKQAEVAIRDCQTLRQWLNTLYLPMSSQSINPESIQTVDRATTPSTSRSEFGKNRISRSRNGTPNTSRRRGQALSTTSSINSPVGGGGGGGSRYETHNEISNEIIEANNFRRVTVIQMEISQLQRLIRNNGFDPINYEEKLSTAVIKLKEALASAMSRKEEATITDHQSINHEPKNDGARKHDHNNGKVDDKSNEKLKVETPQKNKEITKHPLGTESNITHRPNHESVQLDLKPSHDINDHGTNKETHNHHAIQKLHEEKISIITLVGGHSGTDQNNEHSENVKKPPAGRRGQKVSTDEHHPDRKLTETKIQSPKKDEMKLSPSKFDGENSSPLNLDTRDDTALYIPQFGERVASPNLSVNSATNGRIRRNGNSELSPDAQGTARSNPQVTARSNVTEKEKTGRRRGSKVGDDLNSPNSATNSRPVNNTMQSSVSNPSIATTDNASLTERESAIKSPQKEERVKNGLHTLTDVDHHHNQQQHHSHQQDHSEHQDKHRKSDGHLGKSLHGVHEENKLKRHHEDHHASGEVSHGATHAHGTFHLKETHIGSKENQLHLPLHTDDDTRHQPTLNSSNDKTTHGEVFPVNDTNSKEEPLELDANTSPDEKASSSHQRGDDSYTYDSDSNSYSSRTSYINYSTDDMEVTGEVKNINPADMGLEELPAGWEECVNTTMATAAHHAAFHGYPETLEFLSMYFDCFVLDDKGRTPLYYAALQNRLDCVSLLVSIDARWIEVGDENGDTPLHAAANSNGVEVLKFLLTCEVSADTANHVGITPCHVARSLDVLLVLYDAGAQPFCSDSKSRLPLWFACNDGRSDNVSFLCSVTPSQFLLWPDDEGETPLHKAASQGHAKCVEILCQWVTNIEDLYVVNNKSFTAAHVAKNAAVLKTLYENGANLWIKESKGRMPLFVASFFNRVDCIAFLLDIANQNKVAVPPPDHQVDSAVSPGKPKETVHHKGTASNDHLQQVHAGVKAKDQQGDTALHVACLCGHIQCVILLLYFLRNEPNKRKLTPDQLAFKAGHQQIAEVVKTVELKKVKEKLNAENIFATPFSTMSAVIGYYGSRWTKFYDFSFNSLYYVDRATGNTQWDRPYDYDESAKDEKTCDTARKVLMEFYNKYNPSKLKDLNDILVIYKGKYTDLFVTLANKYNVEDLSMFAGIDVD